MIEIHVIKPHHEDALARFFEILITHGANRYFQPHPFTAAEARKRANYKGRSSTFFCKKSNAPGIRHATRLG